MGGPAPVPLSQVRGLGLGLREVEQLSFQTAGKENRFCSSPSGLGVSLSTTLPLLPRPLAPGSAQRRCSGITE